MRITNQQKKKLSDVFNENSLNLLDFEVSGNYQEFKIKFKFDYFSFSIIRQDIDKYQTTILSVDNTRTGTSILNWDGVFILFKKWIKKIKDELTTPSGWETFESENYLNAKYHDLDTYFSKQ